MPIWPIAVGGFPLRFLLGLLPLVLFMVLGTTCRRRTQGRVAKRGRATKVAEHADPLLQAAALWPNNEYLTAAERWHLSLSTDFQRRMSVVLAASKSELVLLLVVRGCYVVFC